MSETLPQFESDCLARFSVTTEPGGLKGWVCPVWIPTCRPRYWRWGRPHFPSQASNGGGGAEGKRNARNRAETPRGEGAAWGAPGARREWQLCRQEKSHLPAHYRPPASPESMGCNGFSDVLISAAKRARSQEPRTSVSGRGSWVAQRLLRARLIMKNLLAPLASRACSPYY